MRFLLRFVSLLLLAAAIIVGVVDAIQSVAGETVSLTPFGAALFTINPAILDATETFFRTRLSAVFWDTAVEWLLLQPASLVLLGAALVFWLVAYKRRPAERLVLRAR